MKRATKKQKAAAQVKHDVAARVCNIYERVVRVYDIKLPGGKIYRWDNLKDAQRFAVVNKVTRANLVRLPNKFKLSALMIEMETTPAALVSKKVARHVVRGMPHSVQAS